MSDSESDPRQRELLVEAAVHERCDAIRRDLHATNLRLTSIQVSNDRLWVMVGLTISALAGLSIFFALVVASSYRSVEGSPYQPAWGQRERPVMPEADDR